LTQIAFVDIMLFMESRLSHNTLRNTALALALSAALGGCAATPGQEDERSLPSCAALDEVYSQPDVTQEDILRVTGGSNNLSCQNEDGSIRERGDIG
jgi:starvation-inducible outer membrane lipoprotein